MNIQTCHSFHLSSKRHCIAGTKLEHTFAKTVTEVYYIYQYIWRCMQSLTIEETCQILLEQMLGYVSSVSNVDSLFSSSAMPSVESYWQRRERTAAVYCVICTFPWVFCCVLRFLIFLPSNQQALHMDSILRELTWRMSICLACGNIHLTWLTCKSSTQCSSHSWTLTTASISSDQTIYTHSKRNMYVMRPIPHLTLDWHWQHQNDGQLENLIPVLMANTGLDVNQAMQLSYHICRLEVEGFCANADRLRVGEDAQGRRIREVFINCSTDMFMGLIH